MGGNVGFAAAAVVVVPLAAALAAGYTLSAIVLV